MNRLYVMLPGWWAGTLCTSWWLVHGLVLVCLCVCVCLVLLMRWLMGMLSFRQASSCGCCSSNETSDQE